MAYATASDVTTRWGRDIEALGPETVALITVRLDDVERMIDRAFKKKATSLEAEVSGTLDVADVVQVEADAVLRLARNPDNYLSETDGNYTYMLQNSLSTGELEILPGEWETLGLVSNGMFVIAPNVVRAT